MQVIEYFSCDRPEYWLRQIEKSDWEAGRFLHELLSQKFSVILWGNIPKCYCLQMEMSLFRFVHIQKKMIFSQQH